jgi:hypothetical protein
MSIRSCAAATPGLEVPSTKGHERFTDRKWRQVLIDTRT